MQTTLIIILIVSLVGIIRDFLRNRLPTADPECHTTLTRLVISPQLDRAEATITTPQGIPYDEDEIMANVILVFNAICTERQLIGLDRIPPADNPVMIDITHRIWNPAAQCYVDRKYPPHPFGVTPGP